MDKREIEHKNVELASKLIIDCDKCSGLCCVALCFQETAGFPEDKEPGKPCKNLMSDFRCTIYQQLAQNKMKGCLAYDCFGAGQKVTQDCFPNRDWSTNQKQANEVFAVFLVIFQLHQMLWYLIEALSVTSDDHVSADIEGLIVEIVQMTEQSPAQILSIDVDKYRLTVNNVLKNMCRVIAVNSPVGKQSKDFLGKDFNKRNLNGRDFSMSLLIAANLEGCSLRGTNFLGADMRDANITNTDLSESIFLTQMQINSARGNANTKLPRNLSRPTTWQ